MTGPESDKAHAGWVERSSNASKGINWEAITVFMMEMVAQWMEVEESRPLGKVSWKEIR